MPPSPKSLFKNTMWNTFFNIFCDYQNAQTNLEYKYGHSHFKSAFGIDFGLWKVVKLKLRHLSQLAVGKRFGAKKNYICHM